MTCKNCGRAITLDRGTYWVHVETDLVWCQGYDTQAQPK